MEPTEDKRDELKDESDFWDRFRARQADRRGSSIWWIVVLALAVLWILAGSSGLT